MRHIIFLFINCILLANSGGPGGNFANNAPNYNNCTSCHYGSVNTSGGSVFFTGLPVAYEPGETYAIGVTVTGANQRGYGFQAAAQSGNTTAGQFSSNQNSDNLEMSGNLVQHSSRTSSGSWVFDWIAPMSDIGDITFSVSGLATGGASGNSGDDMYIASQTIPVQVPDDTLDLFFSEYSEGSSNNKYLEIFNPTEESIDLAGYGFPSVANDNENPGQHEFWNSFPDGAAIAPGDVYIISHPSADPLILDQSDHTHTYLSNGNDAYALVYGTESSYTVIDVIGQNITDLDYTNPGDATGWDVAGIEAATKDHTLVRKSTVSSGNTDWNSSAGTNANDSEWIVFDQDTWDYLGFHIYGTTGGNIDPIASAGPDQVVDFNSEVTLDGSASIDVDGSIVSFEWLQLGGAQVFLDDNDVITTSFMAPSELDTLHFSLTVTDDGGLVDSDTVAIRTRAPINNLVFFSEYAEGSSNNKYLEIFNGSETVVDLSQYALSSCSNGCNDGVTWDYVNNVEFDEGTVLNPGEVFVVCHQSADEAILSECDQFFTYLSNGNDAFGLVDASNGALLDIIGVLGEDPGVGWDVAGVVNATQDHTLVRKSNVEIGNGGDWTTSSGTNESDSEWIVYGINVWDNLGSHNQNLYAPEVMVVEVTPEFIASNTEVEIMANLISESGTIESASIYFGTDGSLLNQTEMWQDSENTWMGIIEPQPGNTLLQFKVVASDDSGNEGESPIEEKLVANTAPTEIQSIHNNIMEGQIVTIQGIVTIGSGVLDDDDTRAYIQDESGRGLNLFDYDLMSDIDRGDELIVVGYVEQYFTTLELVNFVYNELSSDNPLPSPIIVTTSEANSSAYEGTLISYQGEITSNESVSDGLATKLKIDDLTFVQIWSTTGIPTDGYQVGTSWMFTGVGSQYMDDYQLLVGYVEDISTLGLDEGNIVVDKFALSPIYPNPFNPSATVDFTLNVDGDIQLIVFDVKGRVVEKLKSSMLSAGEHRVIWNANPHPSGLYFIRLDNGSQQLVQKVMYLK